MCLAYTGIVDHLPAHPLRGRHAREETVDEDDDADLVRMTAASYIGRLGTAGAITELIQEMDLARYSGDALSAAAWADIVAAALQEILG